MTKAKIAAGILSLVIVQAVARAEDKPLSVRQKALADAIVEGISNDYNYVRENCQFASGDLTANAYRRTLWIDSSYGISCSWNHTPPTAGEVLHGGSRWDYIATVAALKKHGFTIVTNPAWTTHTIKGFLLYEPELPNPIPTDFDTLWKFNVSYDDIGWALGAAVDQKNAAAMKKSALNSAGIQDGAKTIRQSLAVPAFDKSPS